MKQNKHYIIYAILILLAVIGFVSSYPVSNNRGSVSTSEGVNYVGISETPGQVAAFNLASCPQGWKLADGTDGTPDLRGIFIRGAGVNEQIYPANNSYNYTSIQGNYDYDSFQGHHHYLQMNPSTTTQGSPFYPSNIGNGVISAGGSYEGVDDPKSDGLYGNPRISYETAPASYSMIYCVKTAEDNPVSNSFWQRVGNVISLFRSSDKVRIENNLTVDGDLNVTGDFVGLRQYIGGTSFDGEDFNISLTNSGTPTVIRAVAIPYQTIDGNWRMKFNIAISISSVDAGFLLNIEGVIFKNITSFYQSVTVKGGNSANGDVVQAFAKPGLDDIELFSDTSRNVYFFSGDVELDSKPIWSD